MDYFRGCRRRLRYPETNSPGEAPSSPAKDLVTPALSGATLREDRILGCGLPVLFRRPYLRHDKKHRP